MLRAIAGVYVRVFGRGARITIASQAVALLRRFGTDAHVYLPGLGVINGLTAGNYLDSALTTAATVNNPVGGVVDANGTINATQATTANKPILRQTSGKYSWQFDGSNDTLALGSVPFQLADDHCVVVGLSSSSYASLLQTFYNGGSSGASRCASLFISATTGAPTFFWRDNASVSTSLILPAASLGEFQIVSGRKVGTAVIARKNGASQQSGSVSTLGATTVARCDIGSLQGVSNIHNGSIGPVIAIKGTVTNAELLTLERFVSSLTPSGPIF